MSSNQSDNITVINVKKKYLKLRHIQSFKDWVQLPNVVYIGRNMSFYVPGAVASKWANPYTVKKYGMNDCLLMYEKYIKTHPVLYSALHELKGKELGCWCVDEHGEGMCHGKVLKCLSEDKVSVDAD
jgi:hypothetical protein